MYVMSCAVPVSRPRRRSILPLAGRTKSGDPGGAGSGLIADGWGRICSVTADEDDVDAAAAKNKDVEVVADEEDDEEEDNTNAAADEEEDEEEQNVAELLPHADCEAKLAVPLAEAE